MRVRIVKKEPPFLIKYGGVLLLGLAFLLFLGILLFSSHPFEKCVAVVHIDKELTAEGVSPSLFSDGVPGSDEIAENIKKLSERSDIGAVVFVINSPGGSVVATREIYEGIKNLNKSKVAYFREIATSGAYYISTATDYIISEPDAITGSIGVIAVFSDLSELFSKIGVNVTAIKSGESKDIGSPSRPMTEKEKKIIQEIINEVFEEFKEVVIENRGEKLNRALFNEVLDGRIMTGRQAVKVGLVDELGSKEDAINKAKELANLSKDAKICEIDVYGESKDLFDVKSFFAGILNKKVSKISIKYE